jgi:formylglycine-generating enzyme required for sulfatase activity
MKPDRLALMAGSALFCIGTSAALFFHCAPLIDNADRFAHVVVAVQGYGRIEGVVQDTVVSVGERLHLSAVPGPEYVFVGWTGVPFTTANPLTISVEHNISIVAVFARSPVGMAFIPAKGSSFRMGSSSAPAQEYEYPVHTVRFGHDFFIGRCEITQQEYIAFAGNIPAASIGAADVGDSFPVYGLTWYNAVLYCNWRSKQEHYDTVYTYSGICQSPSCPWILENLSIHYDRFGYRLPTEAEWEYACRSGSKTDYYWGEGAGAETAAVNNAWYYVNSNSQSQRVGKLASNSFGLFDMVGNVAEWVNDWLEYFSDSAIVDPVGPADASQEEYEARGERPLRGGSWRLGTSFLRSSCRKGPYRTGAFASAKDIGFRVALGAFSPGNAQQRTRVNDSLLSVTLACGKTELFNFIGANGVKIAFIVKQNGRNNLVFLDCTLPENLAVHRCGNDASVFGTTISPNGKSVAYSSQGEGFSGPCTLTVRCLDTAGSSPVKTSNAYLPHFWVDPSSLDTFLIFSDAASMNNSAKWYTEKTYRQRFAGGNFSGAPSVLWNTGSYHGGLSSDGRFLGTSYPVARLVDLEINDTNIFLFTAPANGRDENPNVLPQICNLQMSPSLAEPAEALLLDFGYPKVNALLGKQYGMHQVIFMCTMRPPYVTQWFEKPEGYDRWDFPRWSNHPGFAVAIAHPATGTADAVYLINRRDSTYLKVATGQNLSYPALWIDPAQVSETDDPYRLFGAYDLPVQSTYQIYLCSKLRLFWFYRESVKCIGVGSSPMYWGLEPAAMTMPTINMSTWASDMFTNVVVARDYVLPHAPHLKAIVLDLVPGLLNRNWNRDPPRYAGLYNSKGYELDASIGFYRNGLPQQVANKIAAYTSTEWPGFDTSGYEFARDTGTGWGQLFFDRGDYDFNDSIVQYSLSQLESLSDSAAAKGVQLLIVSMPESPAYATTSMIGRLGPSRATYDQIVTWINTLMTQNPYVHFYDANNYGNHEFTDSEARDCNHLNYRGGLKLTARIDSLVQLYAR